VALEEIEKEDDPKTLLKAGKYPLTPEEREELHLAHEILSKDCRLVDAHFPTKAVYLMERCSSLNLFQLISFKTKTNKTKKECGSREHMTQ
jgi:hypothetical protein